MQAVRILPPRLRSFSLLILLRHHRIFLLQLRPTLFTPACQIPLTSGILPSWTPQPRFRQRLPMASKTMPSPAPKTHHPIPRLPTLRSSASIAWLHRRRRLLLGQSLAPIFPLSQQHVLLVYVAPHSCRRDGLELALKIQLADDPYSVVSILNATARTPALAAPVPIQNASTSPRDAVTKARVAALPAILTSDMPRLLQENPPAAATAQCPSRPRLQSR
jgi:hypothetical protein